MNGFVRGFIIAIVVAGSVVTGLFWYSSSHRTTAIRPSLLAGLTNNTEPAKEETPPVSLKSPEELRAEALRKSSEVKGLYMTADVANDAGVGATRLRNNIIRLAETTEINAVVIDVKEVCGPDFNPERLKALLTELRQKNIWSIARIVVFKDAAQTDVHPEWYLTRKTPKAVRTSCANKKHLRVKNPNGPPNVTFWRDNGGNYWLDPASNGARNYIISFSKQMIDLGFDELQFDYIRFPSDGEVKAAIYPTWDGKTAKPQIMKSFFELLNRELKSYKPDIILSADLFGYVALNSGDVGIGQRLEDVGDNFDYISFMVYPSHYYSGLYLPADPAHDLPAIKYNASQARTHPDVVVQRSSQRARDFLDKMANTGTSTASSTTATTTQSVNEMINKLQQGSHVRLRPWLEDFFHESDRAAGRPSGPQKVQMQIKGAEAVEKHGWLLWNASNTYTEGALKKEP